MFGMSTVFSCDLLALCAFARNYLLCRYNIENSICFKNVIPVLWKELLCLWNSSGIRIQREQREVNKEVTGADGS